MNRIFKGALIPLVFASGLFGCTAIEGDRILAADLAAANPDFRDVKSTTVIGLAPRPGIPRVIRAGELRALAARHHLVLSRSPSDLCFIRDPARATSPGFDESARFAVWPQEKAGITRGQRVDVEVQSGTAQIHFEASAESSGRTGDSVLVRNPSNGRLFQAKVATDGKVVVQR